MKTIRRLSVGLFLGSALLSTGALAEEPKIMVYKSPTCGCCSKWVSHLQENGFDVETVDVNDLSMIKSMSGIKPELASCHTARVDDYVIEGHVPADDIKRLLAERPEARGLTVPGMPMGSPGMDVPAAGPLPGAAARQGRTDPGVRRALNRLGWCWTRCAPHHRAPGEPAGKKWELTRRLRYFQATRAVST